jgi:hypothetical protein
LGNQERRLIMTVRNIALDPGFGGFKAAEAPGDAVKVVVMPSVVGRRWG